MYPIAAFRRSVALSEGVGGSEVPKGVTLDALALVHQQFGDILLELSAFGQHMCVCYNFAAVGLCDGSVFGDGEVHRRAKVRHLSRTAAEGITGAAKIAFQGKSDAVGRPCQGT